MKTGGYLHTNIFDDQHLHQFSNYLFDIVVLKVLKLILLVLKIINELGGTNDIHNSPKESSLKDLDAVDI